MDHDEAARGNPNQKGMPTRRYMFCMSEEYTLCSFAD